VEGEVKARSSSIRPMHTQVLTRRAFAIASRSYLRKRPPDPDPQRQPVGPAAGFFRPHRAPACWTGRGAQRLRAAVAAQPRGALSARTQQILKAGVCGADSRQRSRWLHIMARPPGVRRIPPGNCQPPSRSSPMSIQTHRALAGQGLPVTLELSLVAKFTGGRGSFNLTAEIPGNGSEPGNRDAWRPFRFL